jgi:hypothetical protein
VDKCECKYTIECDDVETSTWNIKMKPMDNVGSVAKVECTSKGVQDNDIDADVLFPKCRIGI